MRIAFAGNPNSGKTTMYNALTGRNEKVGNWAGVTVSSREAPIKRAYTGGRALTAVDLPGAYSMSPFTAEERVTSDYVKKEKPDVIVNIVDATNLSRSLFFTTQLLELGIPVVVALNKSDINEKRRTLIDTAALEKALGCPVVETVSTRQSGLEQVVQAALSQIGKWSEPPYDPGYVELADKRAVELADRRRFAFVARTVKAVEQRSHAALANGWQDTLDAVLTNPISGIAIFALVMFLVFQISQAWLGPWLAEGCTSESGFAVPGLVTLIDLFKDYIAGLLESANANFFLAALLTEGIIGGVSAVVGFLPLVMVMYFLISLLEDCGYMARATVVLDPIFKRVGLSGKSVIPFIVGTGCAIPGVMAVRTIRSERERNATAMLTPFMPCGAKLPVIALFAGAFFEDASWVGTLMYFVGIAVILLCALLVRAITGSRGSSYFLIELPDYKAPSLKRAIKDMCSRGWAYIVKAGTVILLCNTAVYIMQSFDWHLQPAEAADSSILASIANPAAAVLVPIVGVRAWQLAAAAVTGFIAKENVVGTLAVCYGISNLISPETLELSGGAGGSVAAVMGITRAAALAYLMFNLFSPPCFAAMGAMNAELTDKRWLWGGIALQLGVGYTLGCLVYTLGTLLTAPRTLDWGAALAGFIAVAAMAILVTWLCRRSRQKAPAVR